MEYLFLFVFHSPLVMSFVMMIGAIVYHFFRDKLSSEVRDMKEHPLVSILVPCHDEEANLSETMGYLMSLNYPNYEVIAVNDASRDHTLELMRKLQSRYDRLRIVNFTSNQGKGMGLTLGAMVARGEYIVTVDADAVLDPEALNYFVWHLHEFPRVGAVTGNPRVRNRTSILGKIQVGEFSAIIGMIKRMQRVLGKIFTVSGVIAAFKKRALLHVGFWSNNMVTEDIDISWKMQTRFWDIRYEPRALCWILMPETLKGLWKQRFRWAQGGAEVFRKFGASLLSWKQRRIWPICLEYLLSVIWAYCLFLTVFVFLLGQVVELPPGWVVRSIVPGWTGMILSMICLYQMMIGLLIDSRFERSSYRLFFWIIWYPLVYWILNAAVTIFAFPKAMLKPVNNKAVWTSPDRGL